MEQHKGFALLLILLVTSIFLSISIYTWKHLSLVFDVVCEREQFYQHFYLAENLLNVSSLFIVQNQDTFFQSVNHKSMRITIPEHDMYATLHIRKPNNQELVNCVLVTVNVKKEQQSVMVLRCLMHRIKKMNIDAYEHDHEISPYMFSLSHFTLCHNV